eukprot:CAMPEP_0184104000 /NCGR_PEP_ID=MMETSP0974-20121125/14139_1 /TAXON_ID=483370 /ORGANISM="non described non described, Strain CCMP2097" /LENGTH=42 /DNA_ID= /DNA_START= /DNA_END= /DNA_ORIENTATION=
MSTTDTKTTERRLGSSLRTFAMAQVASPAALSLEPRCAPPAE